jgi:hypothetical protein
MTNYTDIEKQFIREQLLEHAKYLKQLFTEDIAQKKLIESGQLAGTFVSTGNFKEYENLDNHHLELKFTDYGRFIEIAFHKKILTTKDIQNPFVKPKKKKNTKWYTHNVYGAQNRLIGRLMYGLTDIERERIKNSLIK